MAITLAPERLLEYKTKLDRNFLNFIEFIIKRLRLDWDLVIAITGEQGSGKSSLAIWLGFLIDRAFDLKENIAYIPSSDEIKNTFNRLKKYSVFVVDEAVRTLHKYKWFDKLQQAVLELYETERYQNKCSIMVMPRFKNFTEGFRNHRIKLWINILARDSEKKKAIAIVYLRDDDKDIKDPWHFDESIKFKNKKFQNKRIAERTIQEKLAIERKTMNYLFDFEFPPLPEDIEEEYQRLRAISRKLYKKEEKELKNKKIDIFRNSVMKAIKLYKKNNPNISQEELAVLFGLSQKTISNLLKNQGKI